MRYSNRVDANHHEIVQALRQVGCQVEIINRTIDLLVGCPGSKRLVVMEIKNGKKAKLKPSQEKFFKDWSGYPVYRVNSVEEALAVVGVNYARVPA